MEREVEIVLKETIDPIAYRSGRRIEIPAFPHPSERILHCGCGSSSCRDYHHHGISMVAIYFGRNLCTEMREKARYEIGRRLRLLERLTRTKTAQRDYTINTLIKYTERSLKRWQNISSSIEEQYAPDT